MAKQKPTLLLQEVEKRDMEEINDKLQFSYIIDLKKPEIDKFERAAIIKDYMKRNLVSFDEMCKKLNIKKSTLSGWIKWDNITEEEYKTYKDNGMSETDVTNMLKGTDAPCTESAIVAQMNGLLKNITNSRTVKFTDETYEVIRTLRNTLNTLLYKAEKNGFVK